MGKCAYNSNSNKNPAEYSGIMSTKMLVSKNDHSHNFDMLIRYIQ